MPRIAGLNRYVTRLSLFWIFLETFALFHGALGPVDMHNSAGLHVQYSEMQVQQANILWAGELE